MLKTYKEKEFKMFLDKYINSTYLDIVIIDKIIELAIYYSEE